MNYDTYKKHADEIQNIKEKYSGESNSDKRKNEVWSYINNLSISKAEKIMLFKASGNYSISQYEDYMFNYINKLNITKSEKEQMWQQLYGK